jgi:hypothetical protein
MWIFGEEEFNNLIWDHENFASFILLIINKVSAEDLVVFFGAEIVETLDSY